jgi:hypothetical protein
VKLCPRAGVAAPPRSATAAVAITPRPAAAQAGACELAIYSDPSFAGTATSTTENQPRLVEVGWKDAIASVQVKGGTWEFFSGDEYAGEAMRLQPGQYAELGDKWTRQIGSFMCLQ